MKLVLIRHGESEWNRLNLFTGWMDVDLSEKGREEAKNKGKILKEEGYDFDVCYTSYSSGSSFSSWIWRKRAGRAEVVCRPYTSRRR